MRECKAHDAENGEWTGMSFGNMMCLFLASSIKSTSREFPTAIPPVAIQSGTRIKMIGRKIASAQTMRVNNTNCQKINLAMVLGLSKILVRARANSANDDMNKAMVRRCQAIFIGLLVTSPSPNGECG